MRRAGRLFALLTSLPIAAAVATAHEKAVEGDEVAGDVPDGGTPCEGSAAAGFPCENVDLLAWMPTLELAGGLANDIWGWTDPRSGREYALVGSRGGTAFVDISDPTRPVNVAILRTQTASSLWRDIKTHADHAFVVSEAAGHGMQIFDLTRLADMRGPTTLVFADAHYGGFGNAHNLGLDEETGMAFAVGTNTCGGGLHMVDVTRPTEPVFAGCFDGDGYTHDVQCVVYRGPDLEHLDREICFGSNEDTVTIVDVTSRDAPRMLSRTGYPDSAYTHQGWLTEDHRYFLLGDELDERRFGHAARTYVWDVQDLEAPRIVGHYTSPQRSVDHNVFAMGNHVFEANYRSGLRVLRMGDLARAELAQVAFFDTFPTADGFAFSGAWGVYPFFESGVVAVSDINRGLFVLRPDLGAVPECSDGLDNDRDGLTDHPEDPGCEGPEGAAESPRDDVAIDVKPGQPRNVLNPRARGIVRVAVLGSASFGVGAVETATLRLGPGGAPPLEPPRRADVDGDGRPDLVALYPLRDADLPPDASRVCLHWEIHEGDAYRGCDAIRSVPEDDPRAQRDRARGAARRPQ